MDLTPFVTDVMHALILPHRAMPLHTNGAGTPQRNMAGAP
jgi:hypothetical protein